MRVSDGNRLGLLRLNHCVPESTSDACRVRVWQMLRLASQSHRIYLVCLKDGPINLTHWLAARYVAEEIFIEPSASAGFWLRQVMAAFCHGFVGLSPPLRRPTETSSGEQSSDLQTPKPGSACSAIHRTCH